MLQLTPFQLERINDLCRTHQVQRLEIFGSAATDRYDPDHSDIDFLVEFAPLAPEAHANAFFGLADALEELFGRHVDLLELRAIRNPYLQMSIDRSRRTLYEAA